jgi:hypothetical protein
MWLRVPCNDWLCGFFFIWWRYHVLPELWHCHGLSLDVVLNRRRQAFDLVLKYVLQAVRKMVTVNSMDLHTLVTLAVPLALSLRARTFGVLTRLDEFTARLNHTSEFFFIHIFTT